nr:chemotaxis protein CheB [uncultured Flavobacterium sp.]
MIKNSTDSVESVPQNILFPDDYIVVIGGSAGGFQAIKKIIKDLPKDFRPPIFIVWHTGAETEGVMPGVLNKINSIFAAYALDGEEIKPNRIYIAPPDHHMLLIKNTIKLSKGPKENHFRPAVDPLFRSASYHFGSRTIGIILSGALDDGTSGLWKIKASGGIAIVQDPNDAEVKSMPETALRNVTTDYCAPASEIGNLLTQIIEKEPDEIVYQDEQTALEIQSAAGIFSAERQSFNVGELSPFTCPECHGVLSKIIEGNVQRFRCHTGHAFSAAVLLESLQTRIENDLYTAMAGMDECSMLLNHLGDHLAEMNNSSAAAFYFIKAKETDTHAQALRRNLKNFQQLSYLMPEGDPKNLKNETKC